jgi:hypothetical protein
MTSAVSIMRPCDLPAFATRSASRREVYITATAKPVTGNMAQFSRNVRRVGVNFYQPRRRRRDAAADRYATITRGTRGRCATSRVPRWGMLDALRSDVAKQCALTRLIHRLLSQSSYFMLNSSVHLRGVAEMQADGSGSVK